MGLKYKELLLLIFKFACRFIQQGWVLPVRLIAIKVLGQFSYKIHMHRKELDINDNFKIYEIYNMNILPDIFEVLLNVKDNTTHVILETLLQLNKLSPVYALGISEIGSKQLLRIFTLHHTHVVISKIIVSLINALSHNKDAF